MLHQVKGTHQAESSLHLCGLRGLSGMDDSAPLVDLCLDNIPKELFFGFRVGSYFLDPIIHECLRASKAALRCELYVVFFKITLGRKGLGQMKCAR